MLVVTSTLSSCNCVTKVGTSTSSQACSARLYGRTRAHSSSCRIKLVLVEVQSTAQDLHWQSAYNVRRDALALDSPSRKSTHQYYTWCPGNTGRIHKKALSPRMVHRAMSSSQLLHQLHQLTHCMHSNRKGRKDDSMRITAVAAWLPVTVMRIRAIRTKCRRPPC